VPHTPPAAPPAWRTAAVQRRAHLSRGEVTAAEEGIVLWKVKDRSRVEQGMRLGILRIWTGPVAVGAADRASAARIRELEALASKDPIYRDFLEKERRALQRRRSGRIQRDIPLVAPASGTVSLAVASRARLDRGATLAAVVDERVWVFDAILDGAPAPQDASCELRGDAMAERIPCELETVQPSAGGSQLLVRAPAEGAPWVERSPSLRVRIAPPGTPPEAPEVPGKGTP
jgi:hypothetical protein